MKKKVRLGIELVFIFCYMILFWVFSSGFPITVFTVVCAVIASFHRYQTGGLLSGKQKTSAILLSALYGLAVCLAEYTSITNLVTGPNVQSLISTKTAYGITFLLSAVVAFIIINDVLMRKGSPAPTAYTPKCIRRTAICLGSLIALIDLAYLFLVAYPGIFRVDTLAMIRQVYHISKLTNKHPIWYSYLIKLFMELGKRFLGGVNPGIAAFCCLQIIVCSLIIGYALYRLMEMGVSRIVVFLIGFWFALSPMHIMQSSVMLTDTLFSYCGLLFGLSLFRLSKFEAEDGPESGCRHMTDWILLGIGGLSFVALRTNGWYAYLALFLTYLIFCKKQRGIKIFLVCLTLGAFFLTHTLISDILRIPQPDRIEHMSIPTQQIARVLISGIPLTSEEETLLSQVADLDDIRAVYDPINNDHVKKSLRAFGMQDYLDEHMKDYLFLWITLGLKNPKEYIQAWVDQTAYTWYGGYIYGFTKFYEIPENDFGIIRTVNSTLPGKLFDWYGIMFKEHPFFLPFFANGFQVWILLICAAVCISRKNFAWILSAIPIFVTVTLAIATPNGHTWRYAYPVFVILPFALAVSIWERKRQV